jgi:hypothetical protein
MVPAILDNQVVASNLLIVAAITRKYCSSQHSSDVNSGFKNRLPWDGKNRATKRAKKGKKYGGKHGLKPKYTLH